MTSCLLIRGPDRPQAFIFLVSLRKTELAILSRRPIVYFGCLIRWFLVSDQRSKWTGFAVVPRCVVLFQ